MPQTLSFTPNLESDPSAYLNWLDERVLDLSGLTLSQFVNAYEAGLLDRAKPGTDAALSLLKEHL